MKSRLFAIASLVALLSAAPALADDAKDTGLYANIGVDSYDFEAFAVGGKLGYNFNRYLGLEGQLSFGVSGDEETEIDEIVEGLNVRGQASAGIDNTVAAFARLTLPVSDQVGIFARGGYHRTRVGFETSPITVTNGPVPFTLAGVSEGLNFDGVALGGGVEFMFDELNGLRLEYTYFDIDEIDDVDLADFDDDIDFGDVGSNMISLSYVRRF
jgi:opacity protein-like surface antigen